MIFDGIHYLQKLGCAMGTICTLSYANIFMEKFERNFIYLGLQIFSNFYRQFIDDILLLWNRSETQILDFITRLNFRHPTIKFNFKHSKSSIRFLDTKTCKKKENNKLLTTIYQKPTDRRKFLDPTSAHPKSLINNIPYSQVLQLKRSTKKYRSLTNI